MLCVLARELEQLGLSAAFWLDDLHPAPSVLAEELLERFAHLDCHRHQNLVRKRSPVGIVLPEKGSEHLVVWHRNPSQRKRAHAKQAPAAHAQYGNFDLVALTVKANHVLVRLLHASHTLFFLGPLDGAKLIAIYGRSFVLELSGRAFHSHVDVTDQLAVATVEKPRDVGDLRAVLLLVDFQYARPWATLDLILQTRSRPHTEFGVRARS